MPKASPNRNSFNAGVFSELVIQRTDIDRYPAAMRSAINFVAVPQGPMFRRSGSLFVVPANDNDTYSTLVPFVYNEDQAFQLEFADLALRFHSEAGLQVYDNDAITAVLQTTPFKFTSAALAARGAVVGSQVTFNGFPFDFNLNAVVAKVTAKSGNDFTVDVDYPGATGAVTANAQLVYTVVSPYAHTDARNIRALQSVDVIYLFCDGYHVRKLSRFDTYDWRFSTLDFDTGPFLPAIPQNGVVTLSGTGSPVPVMTSATLPSGTVTSSGDTSAAWQAFDADPLTYWESNTNQSGTLGYTFPAAVVITGYTIYAPSNNSDTSYQALDYAPSNFKLYGRDPSTLIFELLDSQVDYVLYDSMRSVPFPINNTKAYDKYELRVTKCTRNGPINTRIARLALTTNNPTYTDVTMTLSGTYTGFNGGAGFLTTDVGRYVRLKGSDAFWRIGLITARASATSVTLRIIGDPFPSAGEAIRNWSLGYYSDNTGWPRVGVFFDDRLWVGGSVAYPDLVAGSKVGGYEDFSQTTPDNVVQDDSALAFRLNSRRLSRVMWLESDERGLLIGTGSAEWVITASGTDQALTARNPKARSATARGSAFIEPIKADSDILFVQAARRTVRKYGYVFESDGYKSPSLSMFASNMGTPRIAQMCYCAEPHSVVWMRRDDGSVIGLTYNPDQNLTGWHNHDFGGVVESISSIPSATDKQDVLWMVVNRTIDGGTKRYIERLMRFWDFDSVVQDAHFVDSGLRYDGDPITVLYGLPHLEGEFVRGLADGVPFPALQVVDGSITLPFPASVVIVGKSFTSEAETTNLEAGAADGTAQGKVGRMNNLSIALWKSAYGEIGVYNEDSQQNEYRPIKYREDADELMPIALVTDILDPMDMPSGYNKRKSMLFRQTEPLPFNVVALLPQVNTQDR